MIFAELHGKIADGAWLHERREDVLTSTAFGLLRYVAVDSGIVALLRRGRKVRLQGDEIVVDETEHLETLDRWAKCEWIFWDRHPDFGEPDLRIEAKDSDGKLLAVVIIEAKYLSPKSGVASEDVPFDPAAPDPDQLARYAQILSNTVRGVESAVFYLTAHSAPPVDELRASLTRIPDPNLFWLAWRDLWTVASTLRASSVPMEDLELLLAHKGLKPFTGWRVDTILSPPHDRLFAASRGVWFTGSSILPLPSESIWRKR
jgi:hypothetical protein